MAKPGDVRHIAVIDGHPDPDPARFCHALAEAYADAAVAAGHGVQRITVAELNVPFLRTKDEFEAGAPPDDIRPCQAAILGADHLVIIYPLWLGTMPALLKAFLEQVFRLGHAAGAAGPGEAADKPAAPAKPLAGKTVRIVITMGMPALLYRWYFGAHSLKSLERNILGFAGAGPIRETLIGSIEAGADTRRRKWLGKVRALGRAGR